MMVRMMRDRGFDYYRQDKYCENLFANHFDMANLHQKTEFELVTAFEVFEHLPNPLQGIEEILHYSSNILFSTELVPDTKIGEWWYLVPEVGQHVSLCHYKTLEYIGKKYKLNLYSNRFNTHLLTSKKINPWIFRALGRHTIASLFSGTRKKETLLHKDFNFLKEKLTKKAEDNEI